MTRTATQAPTELNSAAADQAIVFPDGLVGCHKWKQFVLMVDDDSDDALPVAVLQSLDEPDISLLVTNPTLLDPSFCAHLSQSDRAELGLEPDQEPVLYCTLTVSQDGWLTANLLGPLVVNPTTRRGKQVVLVDSGYTTRHQVAPLVVQQEA